MDLAQKLLSCIKTNSSYSLIKEMDILGELDILIPITKEMKSVGECKYHVVNCFEHSLMALKIFEEMLYNESFFQSHIYNQIYSVLNEKVDDGLTKKDLLKLGILLHDMGKPEAKTIDNTERVRFRKHEIIGANKIFSIGNDLGLSYRSKLIIYKYIRYHMELLQMYKTGDMSKNKLFNLFDKLDDETIEVFLLGYADIVSTRKLLNPNEDMKIIETYMNYAITNYLYSYKLSNK
ncbi:MAG: HD domain-containing protein [Paraclostridium sp.]